MLQYSPKIVTDGLVMCLDPSQNKSYPTDLPVKNGLVMWMDAADDTTFSYSSGTTVSQWRDKSGFNYHMVPVSAGPTRNAFLNSRKVLACTTSQQIWNSSINLSTSVYTIFGVTRLTGTTNARVLTTQYVPSTGGNWLLGHWAEHVNQYFAEGWVSGPYGTSANTAWNIFMGDWSGSSTDLANLYTNGTAIVTNSNGASAGPLGLGINVNSETSTCEAAEIIVFNRVLSTTERRLVHTYLGQKWGILNTDRSIVDLGGNNYNGLLGNGTVANMPFFDYYNKGALKFDGSNDYITTGVSSIVPTSTAPYTVSVWCYRNTNNSSHKELLAQWTYANSGNSFFFGFQDSAVRFTDNWNPITVSGAGNTNVWMNLVGVYTVSNAYIYLNGVLAATKGSGFSYTGTGPFVIGRQGELNSEYFDGNIGNVLVYNRALSATEISQNYEAQKSKFTNTIVQQGLVLNLDAGNPYSYAGAGTTWYDVSGNSNNGTLTNGPTFSNTNGGSIVFDGTDDRVTSFPTQISGTGSKTINCFFKTSKTVRNGLCGIRDVSVPSGWVFTVNRNAAGNLTYFHTGGGIIEVAAGISINTWYNACVTYNASTATAILYLNGVQIGSPATSFSAITSTSFNGVVGSEDNAFNDPFGGSIGLLQIYNRALTATEVLQNYNATKDRFGL